MTRGFSRFGLACAAVVGAQAGLGLYIVRFGPTHPIPLHFNGNGAADRWGDRADAGGFVVAMAVLSATMIVAGHLFSRRLATGPAETARSGAVAQMILLFVTTAVCGLVAAASFGWLGRDGELGGAGMAALCLILVGMGAYLGKVGPNPLVGVRTPWTYSSRLAWDKANRLAGRLFFWGGLAGLLAAPVAPQPEGFRAVIFGVLVAAVIAVWESWRVWRGDPDRTSVM